MSGPVSSSSSSSVRTHPGIVKLACIQEGKLPYLLEFDQSQPLQDIIRNVCTNWQIRTPESYAFKLEDRDVYVTDDNRFDLKNGVVLKLDKTPEVRAVVHPGQCTCGAHRTRQDCTSKCRPRPTRRGHGRRVHGTQILACGPMLCPTATRPHPLKVPPACGLT